MSCCHVIHDHHTGYLIFEACIVPLEHCSVWFGFKRGGRRMRSVVSTGFDCEGHISAVRDFLD